MSYSDRNYVKAITSLTNNEINRIKKLNEIITEMCDKNYGIAELVEIMFWDNSWNAKSWQSKSIEYYMHIGIKKLLDSCCIISTEPDIDLNYGPDDDIINKMNEHKIILASILFFIRNYIHVYDTDSKKQCYGVIIDVTENDIYYDTKIFKNEKEMTKEGYHNDVKYYMTKLNEYAINCLYNNKNN